MASGSNAPFSGEFQDLENVPVLPPQEKINSLSGLDQTVENGNTFSKTFTVDMTDKKVLKLRQVITVFSGDARFSLSVDGRQEYLIFAGDDIATYETNIKDKTGQTDITVLFQDDSSSGRMDLEIKEAFLIG